MVKLQVAHGGFQPSENPTQGRLLPIMAMRIEHHLDEGGPLPMLKEGRLAGHDKRPTARLADRHHLNHDTFP